MTQGVYKLLPKNYFNNLYSKVLSKLVLGQNVLVTVPYGGGGKTFNNFFIFNCRIDKAFDQVLFFDPEVENSTIVNYVKENVKRHNQKTLIATRLSIETKNLNTILERLNRLRLPDPENLVYLAITDHNGLIYPEKFFAQTNVFFPERFVIKAFNLAQTKDMVNVLHKYYGWEIDNKLVNKVYKLSGGIPRLIKIICKELAENRTSIEDIDRYLSEPSIIFQLKYITELIFEQNISILQDFGYLDDNGQIISSLLERYFNTYTSSFISRNFPLLSSKETEMMTYFYENKGKVIAVEKIAQLLSMSDEDYSLWAIYKSISRLKKKIQPKFTIENIKGKGYILKKQA